MLQYDCVESLKYQFSLILTVTRASDRASTRTGTSTGGPTTISTSAHTHGAAPHGQGSNIRTGEASLADIHMYITFSVLNIIFGCGLLAIFILQIYLCN